ncbi:MAG: class 1 fructose-bisphosphatase [Candidatus Jettenia sp.]|uniref:Fructose-1,6-bisphosphatase class 1 n=1 Tax=Candidatus Jettenia caeni TaxID=247490 RepID=I3IGM8_9BACT|nr:class 1 fructose-bisphosphatase [Candidatus Jettenia sp. AMX1]MBC6927838.1 class 1 fructose-bisphosphatase [Candidatus Jettenia sp.]NUN24917.1 class 1 fructose-bisphosphatase [Candidatus Jettenia caeni]KAA0251248.1 MAG: class 1 fructose-bisphosphatase [Candidatus Jettenia sp. AMX1]MCE7880270.1 class 1 fructose-bisphosphatase [Candidatus Jettenia sp. AMX1]MCQ3926197.1 class 1 fructose-bisphosphatase [Candidatus Jettenia sp.]
MQKSKVVTIQRHIVEQERLHPNATGDFTCLLWDLTIAAKTISREVNKAGLADILGITGENNIHGDVVKKLDVYANEKIYKSMNHGGHLCIMASEENEDIIPIPDEFPKGKYVLLFDPLDGSSNIDANVCVGTIFSIYRRKTTGKESTIEDCLRKGTDQVAAGYIIYGSSTMMVYTTGQGVHGFTLDPSIGEFLLSHENIRIPSKGKIYSINEGNANTWDEGTKKYIAYLKENDPSTERPYSLRYIGSLVSDFHRNLLYGGIFLYPVDYKDPKKPKAKLRLLYEAAPLAFIVEQAGGKASTGKERILNIQATELHQKVPLVIGSKEDVLTYEKFFSQK